MGELLRRSTVVLSFAAILAGLAPAADPPAPEGAFTAIGSYRFSLDGKPVRPRILSIEGTEDDPKAGDVIALGEALLVLRDERDCRFSRKEDGIFLDTGGRRRLIWAETDQETNGDERIRIDPFAKLSGEEARGLWGIHLQDWTPEEAAILGRIDPDRCAVSLRTLLDESLRLPALPAALRCLWIDFMNGSAEFDYSGLSRCPTLRLLAIEDRKAVPLGHVARCAALRYLDLSGLDLSGEASLSALRDLRLLDLRYSEGIESLGFAKEMAGLEVIRLDGSAIRDLSPLADLPRLAAIGAAGTPVASLPEGRFPALKSLDILSTAVTDEDRARFAASHPACRIRHRWEAALKDALAGVDRVRIRSGGTCHRDEKSEKTYAELKEAAAIRELVDAIRIDEGESGSSCMCCGDPSFEFHRGEELVETLGFHHGAFLRWPGGWPGDGALRPESAAFLADWLANRGATGPLEERRRMEEAIRKDAEFLGFFPPAARKALEEAESGEPGKDWDAKAREAWKRVAAAAGDPVAALVAGCRALGDERDSWSSRDFRQAVVLASAAETAPEAITNAFDRVKDDRRALLGAARLVFFEGLLEKLPEAARTETVLLLAEVALANGADGNKDRVMRVLGQEKDSRIGPFLRQVAAGKIGRELDRSKGGRFHPEPGIAASAWLALARRGEDVRADAKGLLEGGSVEFSEDRAALEIVLALLGDPGFIKAEHFLLESFTIGFAALEAIEKFQGREGMDVLVEAGMAHPWAAVNEEAVHVFKRLTGQSWFKEDARAWWKANREKYLEEHRTTGSH